MKEKLVSSIKPNKNGTVDITDSEGTIYKDCYLTNVDNHLEEEGIITISCAVSLKELQHAQNFTANTQQQSPQPKKLCCTCHRVNCISRYYYSKSECDQHVPD